MKLILASFEYQNVWTCADLEEAHYPSTTFPSKIDVQLTLNRMVTYGILEIERDLYRKAE
jgi:hypothetical protein